MATTTDYRATGSQAKFIPTGEIVRAVTFTPAAAGLNDIWKVLDVPAGAYITDLTLDCGDLDSSTGITLDVGDASTPQRFIAASNVGQAGGIVSASVTGCLNYQYTAQTNIQIKVHAAATGFQAAAVTLIVRYSMDP